MNQYNNYLRKRQLALLTGIITIMFGFYIYIIVNYEQPNPKWSKGLLFNDLIKGRQSSMSNLGTLPAYTSRQDKILQLVVIDKHIHKNYRYKITNYYLPEMYKQIRKTKVDFSKCEFSNCDLRFKNDSFANTSDAVIFDGRLMTENIYFSRPPGQVWIFAAHESPATYNDQSKWWRSKKWRAQFNWTMTYDRENSDIYLPYGEIWRQQKQIVRNFTKIALKKNRTALTIVSHCHTRSKREIFVSKLKQTTDVEVLGKCGKPWKCGIRYKHNDCFKLLNTYYRFYLAFENAYCRQYFTEKFFDNFNYDTILISLGGSFANTSSIFPPGSFISTESFKSVADLGRYLNSLSVNDYADMLERKSQYYSVGNEFVYQRAMCEICKRLNNIETYKKQIPDIVRWASTDPPCRQVKYN